MSNNTLKEAATQEAYLIHRMTDSGQDSVQNFMDTNPGLNTKKLTNDLTRNLVNRFEVRDVITGRAHEAIVKKFMKAYNTIKESNQGDYIVKWVDHNYKPQSKTFKNNPSGAPDNALKLANKFKNALEAKHKTDPSGKYRNIQVEPITEDNKLSRSFQKSLTRKPMSAKYIALDPDGNTLPTAMTLKSTSSVYALWKNMNQSPYGGFNHAWKNGGAIYDTKAKKVIAVIIKAHDGWSIRYEETPDVSKLFAVKPNESQDMAEAKLTEAFIPSNIKEFAKRKNVMPLVTKVATWAEKVGKKIAGGTAIGKGYNTLVLDLDYTQAGEIRIDCENETITMFDEPIQSFSDFKKVYDSLDELKENKQTIKLDSFSGTDSDKISDFLNTEKIPFKKVGPIFTISLDRNTPKASVILSQLRRISKFDEVNESNIGHAETRQLEKHLSSNQKQQLMALVKSGKIKTHADLKKWHASLNEDYKLLTKLIRDAVEQAMTETADANDYVDYNPTMHKRLETGAADFELDPTGTIVYAYMPFEEEANVHVRVPFKKEFIEGFTEETIDNQADLDNLSYDIGKYVKSVMTRPDKDQILKKVLKLAESLNENQYFIRTKYTVNKNWFNDPSEVLKTNLHGLKVANTIDSSEIKNMEYDGNDFVAYVNFHTNLNKPSFMKKLEGSSTSSEQWEIL